MLHLQFQMSVLAKTNKGLPKATSHVHWNRKSIQWRKITQKLMLMKQVKIR